ncbi:MAG TPA: Fur family transcriptional regulator [Kineosporiaceae bacterium]
MPTASDYERMIRVAGLRVTRPRVAVLSAVHSHPHADTDSIIGAVREDLGDVSHQTVYDVLHALTGVGLVRRIQPKGSVARYEARVRDNHHHVVCRSCGAIADVDCAVGVAPCLSASDAHGFVIDEAEVIYWGRCPRCVRATAADSAGGPLSEAAAATSSHGGARPQNVTSDRHPRKAPEESTIRGGPP